MELWMLVMVMVVVTVVKIPIVEENGGEDWMKCKQIALLQGRRQEHLSQGSHKEPSSICCMSK